MKKLRNYLIAFVIIFVLLLLGGYSFVKLAWGESALLAVFRRSSVWAATGGKRKAWGLEQSICVLKGAAQGKL